MKKTIKDWSVEDKPREKLLLKGINTLSDAELIAILIGSGNKELTAVDLAREILLDNNSNLNNLGKLSIEGLLKYKGIGQAKAVSIIAALELGKRRAKSEIIELKKINSPQNVFNYMYPLIGDLKHEEFWAIFLNQANKIIYSSKIGQGGINSTTVDIRILMKNAIEKHAIGMILCHNHPSGNIQPSEVDIKLTNKILDAGKILNINIIDHLIISGNQFFSFKDEGLIL
ncbi:MAG: DNA repair protein RadC [Bacteroidales bacterium]|nr:DNA repair protein RadC [Bacteroidales bacterium]